MKNKKPFKIVLFVLILINLLNIVDAFTTHIGLKNSFTESNFIASFLISIFGFNLWVITKIIFFLILSIYVYYFLKICFNHIIKNNFDYNIVKGCIIFLIIGLIFVIINNLKVVL